MVLRAERHLQVFCHYAIYPRIYFREKSLENFEQNFSQVSVKKVKETVFPILRATSLVFGPLRLKRVLSIIVEKTCGHSVWFCLVTVYPFTFINVFSLQNGLRT